MGPPVFKVEFLEKSKLFLDTLPSDARKKIIFNITKATYKIDPELFKKVNKDIWEFRTLYNGIQYRLFAF